MYVCYGYVYTQNIIMLQIFFSGSGPTKHPVDKFRYAECGDKNIHPEFVIYLRQKVGFYLTNSSSLHITLCIG